MAEMMWIRGENGTLHNFDVPLPPGIAHRLEKGDLLRVNEDGSPWAEPSEADAPVDAPPPDAAPLPKRSENRAVWTDFAVSQGMDRTSAAALTKAELIDLLTVPADN